MSFDDVLIGILLGGIVLSGAYIRAEYRLWRSHGAAERQRGMTQGALHAARLARQHDAVVEPHIARLQAFAETPAAGTDIADEETARRSAVRSSMQRTYPYMERRSRPRHEATH
jgi:hypothetical protein